MRKLISLFLSVLVLLPFTLTASAVSITAGPEAAYKCFEEGISTLDYVYFSPVKDEADSTKYPLILWLHGNSSGDYSGHQLHNTDIYKFATDEFQARFVGAGGAFLLLPRDPTKSLNLAWDFALEGAKKTLDDFIEEHGDNIDLNRIYVGGNSMGGKGAFKIAAAYPDVFAAAFPISPVYIPTYEEMDALCETSVWVFSNANDEYPQLKPAVVKAYFTYLNLVSKAPQNNRWSSFSAYYGTGGGLQKDEIHNTWTPVHNDLFMDDGREYLAMTTVDGEGNSITLTYPDGFISWLSSQILSENAASIESKGLLSKIIEMFLNIINAIISIFGL